MENHPEEITALNHVNLHVREGEIFGIVGPNGAGKTTLLKIISTLITPDEGTVTVDGYDVKKEPGIVQRKIGLLAGEFTRSLYWRLTGAQNLKFFADLRNLRDAGERIDELLELFNLREYKDELVMKYSTGMKHKLALALGLLHDPKVLLLDEPLTGIDPLTAHEIKEMIKNRFREKTIIWASHNLYEIEEMCDRIALIKKGNVVLEGKPDDLKRDYWGYTKIRVVTDTPEVFNSMNVVNVENGVVDIETEDVRKTFIEIMELVKKRDIKIREIKTIKPTLEEIFMAGMKNA